MKDRLALASLIILVILFGIIFIGSLFANQEEIMKISLLDKYAIPMKEGFWLGSDSGGRSILGQLILGARNSIIIGFTITILTSGIGIFFGLIAGYYGKWVDNVIYEGYRLYYNFAYTYDNYCVCYYCSKVHDSDFCADNECVFTGLEQQG